MDRRRFFSIISAVIAAAAGLLTAPAKAKFQQWAATAEEEFGRVRYVTGIYARSGEVVTCEQGHVICEFSRDVDVGEPFDAAAPTNWKQSVPQIGTMDQPCEICGTRWFKGSYLHFADGWRIGRY